MKASRLGVLSAAVVVVAGLGLGGLAHLAALRVEARVEKLPAAAAWMPADTEFIAHVDVTSLLSSPFREELLRRQAEKNFEQIEAFKSATGLDPQADLQSICFAKTAASEGKSPLWSLAVKGRLKPDQLVAAIEARQKLEKSTHRGTTLYLSRREPGTELYALAFPESETALFGAPERVRAMIDVGTAGAPSVASGPLAGWLDELPLTETFWCAGATQPWFGQFLPRRDGEAPKILPLKTFALSARVAREVEAFARGEASDPESATKLADTVRGLIAMASLQQQRPELQAVLNSIQIGTAGNRVEVSLSVPYETFQRLAPPPKVEESLRPK